MMIKVINKNKKNILLGYKHEFSHNYKRKL